MHGAVVAWVTCVAIALLVSLLACLTPVRAQADDAGPFLEGWTLPSGWEARERRGADPWLFWFVDEHDGSPYTYVSQGKVQVALIFKRGLAGFTETPEWLRTVGGPGYDDPGATIQGPEPASLDGLDGWRMSAVSEEDSADSPLQYGNYYEATDYLLIVDADYAFRVSGYAQVHWYAPEAGMSMPQHAAEGRQVGADMNALIESLRFSPGSVVPSATTSLDGGSATQPPATDDPSKDAADGPPGWKIVVASAAAALAAAAPATVATKTMKRRTTKRDGKTTVGYVLRVSAATLRLSPSHSVPFSADAWCVHADGTLTPAHGVTVTLAPPAGAGVDPMSGPGGVRASVWQTGDLGGATLTVAVTGAGGGTQASVRLVPDNAVELSFTFPAGPSPNVFTDGWVFGAKAVADPGTPNERDISETVEWSGTGSFDPPTGALSRPHFRAEGENTLTLRVEHAGKVETRSMTVSAISPELFCNVESLAVCPADYHGCPACPHRVQGVVDSGSPTVTVRGAPAARQGDGGTHFACCGSNTFVISGGDFRVIIDGRRAAHIGDATQHCGGTGTLVS